MPLEFIDLNSLLVAAVNCDNRKARGKKNGANRSLKNQQKREHSLERKK